MVAGEPFTNRQLDEVERALVLAEKASGLSFAAYVGTLAEGRATAEQLQAAMPESDEGVLVAVDPDARTVDVVTGPGATRWLNESRCRLAILTMSSRFAYGDIVGGLRDGMVVLAEQAARPKILFTDEPA